MFNVVYLLCLFAQDTSMYNVQLVNVIFHSYMMKLKTPYNPFPHLPEDF